MVRIAALVVCAVVMLGEITPAAWGQEAVLAQLYGEGVHAYFAGKPVEAHQSLTAAIKAGSHDPRVYYFRALAYLQLGRQDEAEADFRRGAELETADVNQYYPVARSLERVQGEARLALERYRTQAHVAAFEQAEEQRLKRFGQNRGAEPVPPAAAGGGAPIADDLLREPIKAGPATVEHGAANEGPGAPKKAEAAAKPAGSDLFGAPEAAPAAPSARQEKAPAPPAARPAGTDPFEGGAKAGGASDPFGASPAVGAGKAAPVIDPFGAAAPAAGKAAPAGAADPFGGDAKNAAPVPAKPPASAPVKGAPDPFAPSAAAPAPASAPAAAHAAPPKETAPDLFGAEQPAAAALAPSPAAKPATIVPPGASAPAGGAAALGGAAAGPGKAPPAVVAGALLKGLSKALTGGSDTDQGEVKPAADSKPAVAAKPAASSKATGDPFADDASSKGPANAQSPEKKADEKAPGKKAAEKSSAPASGAVDDPFK